jgi:glycosyltransferase involved in cell wall biosynthesis
MPNTASRPRRIKVAIVINDFMVGGAQRLIVDTLRLLDSDRYEPTLVVLFDFPGRDTLFTEVPSNVPLHKLAFRGLKDFGSWWRLAKTLRSIRPDVVISHLFFSNLTTRMLAPLLGYASIAVEHNTYVDKRRWQIVADRILSIVSHRIVAVSSEVLDFAANQACIPQRRFQLILNGIDVAAVAAQAKASDIAATRNELGIANDALLLANVARLTSQKRHPELLAAFAALLRTRPDARLMIVGEGPMRPKIETEIKRLGLGSAVILTGMRQDVPRLLAASDYFVSTSAIEGLSIAYLEALACGIPLVVTRTGGTAELVEEGVSGYFIHDATDAAATARRLLEVASMDRAPLSAGAFATAQRFDVAAMTKQYEALIDSAAGRKS